MKKLVVIMAFVATGTMAQDCDMHARHAGVNTRGDKAMGLSHEKTAHHFILTKTGGIIDITANSSSDNESISAIRGHLRHVASEFSKGNYDLPMFIHDRVPPGTPVMQQHKDRIRFRYEERKNGARVVIRTADATALAAIHEFLRFQISDHQTGDSMGSSRR